MWVVWYFLVLAVSFGIYFLYRIGPRSFVVYAVGLAVVFWLVGGEGWKTVRGWFGEETNCPPGVERCVRVKLAGPGKWIDVSDKLPACTRVNWRSYHIKDGHIRYGGKTTLPLAAGVHVKRLTYPIEVKGTGILIFELSEIGKTCG